MFSSILASIMGDFEWWPLVKQVGLVGDDVPSPPPSFLTLVPGKEVRLKRELTHLQLLTLMRMRLLRLHSMCLFLHQPRGNAMKGLRGLVSVRSRGAPSVSKH